MAMDRDRIQNSLTVAELGQVLTQGLMLYRNNWRTHAKLSLQAYAWLWVPIYGWNRYLALSGVISRIGFSTLQGEEPTPAQIKADLKRCRFKFFWLSLRIAWRLLWISMIFILLLSILIGIFVAIFNADGLDSSQPPPAWSIALGVVIYLFPIWPYSNLFLAEMPLAISPGQSIKDSLKASQKVSQGNRWKILGLILSTLFVVTPIATLIGQVLPYLWLRLQAGPDAGFQIFTLLSLPISAALTASSPLLLAPVMGVGIYQLTDATTWQFAVSNILPMFCMTAAAIALLPLWQLVKSALYYKLLCKQEGIDLALPARS